MEPSLYLWHALAWLGPTLGLTALISLYWAVFRRSLVLRGGLLGSALALFVVGAVAQGVCLVGLQWPDGSMASYGVLVAAMSLAQALLARQK